MRAGLLIIALVGGCDLVYSLDRPSGWESAAMGYTHGCARTRDQALYCWGGNTTGEVGIGDEAAMIDEPQRIAGEWTQVASEYQHVCGIKNDHSLWCWGSNSSAQIGNGSLVSAYVPKQVAGGWTHVATGYFHTCAIDDDEHLWCWGSNNYGALGDGTTMGRVAPVQTGDARWREVAVTGASTCGIQSDGSLWCWGDPAFLPLGDPALTTVTPVPSPIGSDTWRSLASTIDGMCGITTAGRLRCWGNNSRHELGLGDPLQAFEPTAVTTDDVDEDDWTVIEGGIFTMCGLRGDEAWCWGENPYGQLASDEPVAIARPVRIEHPGGGAWTNVSLGGGNACFLDDSGRMSCAGTDNFGQLADGGSSPRAPTLVEGAQTAIDAGDYVTCALRGEQLMCAGSNATWQLGIGDDTRPRRSFEVPVEGAWQSVTGGADHQCALDLAGRAWCWGRDQSVVLGNGTSDASATVPTPVAGTETYRQLDAGSSHTCGVAIDNRLWCWGTNGYGEIAEASIFPSAIPKLVLGTWRRVSAGHNFSCGIDSVGNARCWGTNGAGQLGDGSMSEQRTPVLVTGDTLPQMRAISAGFDHTCAISVDDTLYCWGGNDHGQLGYETFPFPSDFARSLEGKWSAVSAAHQFTCGIRTDGTAWCWGLNARGQLGDGTLLDRRVPTQLPGTGWTAITGGTDHACGLREGMTYCWGANNDGATATGDAWTSVLQEIVEPPR